MPIYNVQHVTTYRYRQPVAFGEHRMMLHPRESRDQQLLDCEIIIDPPPESLRWSRDALGNLVGTASFSGRASELRFESVFRVAHSLSHPGDFDIAERARSLPVAFTAEELPELASFMLRGEPSAAIAGWARAFLNDSAPTPTLECLAAINQAIHDDFAYVRRTERGVQEPEQTLASRCGTCRDFTVLMMEALRALGLPARFVSGYLYVASRDRHDIRGGGATHAWLQIHLPGAGWVDFDPTNAIVGNAGLIPVAIACEPEDATPLSGCFTGFRSDELGMDVTVKVTRENAEREQDAAEPTSHFALDRSG